MSCSFDLELLQDFLDGTIDPVEKIVLKEHLKVCSKCSKELLVMKLLFFELHELSKEAVMIPKEMSARREKTLEALFQTSESPMSFTKVLKLQKNNLEYASMFVKFLPGEEYLQTGINKLQGAAVSLSSGLLKGSFKLLQMRFQA